MITIFNRKRKNREMNLVRKMSADHLFDNFLMIWQNNEKIQKEFPNLEGQIKFHRNNYYKVIDQLNSERIIRKNK